MTCFNRSFTERATDDAGGNIFGVADFTGFVNLLAGDAEISSGRSTVLLGNSAYSIPAVGLNLSPLLCRIIFVGKPTLSNVGEILAACFAEIRIRAERRIGELMEAQREGVGFNSGAMGVGSEVRVDGRPTLAEAGIDKHLADRALRTFFCANLGLTNRV